MLVVEMPSEILRLGQPAPVSVRDAQGQLLIRKGTLVATEEQRQRLVSRPLYVDESEGEQLKRIISGQLDAMLRQNMALGEMAKSQADASGLLAQAAPVKKALPPAAAWAHLQMCASMLLRDPVPADFAVRLGQLQEDLLAQFDQDPDQALLILLNLLTTDAHQHHATRALLVAVVGEMAARQAAVFTPEQRTALRCAALTRHMSMAAVQDQLALQDGQPTPQQRSRLAQYAERGVELLRSSGIADELWLGLVERHPSAVHASGFGALAAPLQLSRLLERADRFADLAAVRKSRPAPPAADAAKATFRLASGATGADEAGAIVVKAIGIYPPGSYVKLTSGEVGLVLRRGRDAASPRVASLIGRSGTPLVEPVVRDTRRRPHEVAASLAPRDVRVRLNMEKLLPLA